MQASGLERALRRIAGVKENRQEISRVNALDVFPPFPGQKTIFGSARRSGRFVEGSFDGR